MELWEKSVKAGAAILGALAGLFGEWNALLTVLCVSMLLDYASGLIVAFCGKSPKTENGLPSSKIGFIGLSRKGFILIMVLLATLLDRALGTEAMIFQSATACYYVANEGISILENAGLIGLPVPKVIERALGKLKEPGEKEA